MSESAPQNAARVQRRSTRILQSIPIIVVGTDILGVAFREHALTVNVNCHGCKFRSQHYLAKNSTVRIEIQQPGQTTWLRVTEARVAGVQSPGKVREFFQISVELKVPGNVWGVVSPPRDWFPVPGDRVPS